MILSIIICALYLTSAVMGMTFIKSGHAAQSFCSIPLIGVSLSVRTLVGILFYGLSFLLFVFYVSKLNIGIMVPLLSGLTCIATVFIGYTIFKESISIGQFVGVALVIIGTVIVGVCR